jgi:hypothetical protein
VDITSFLPQDPTTALLALGALVVAITTLWLSYFRGPALELVNSPAPVITKFWPQTLQTPNYFLMEDLAFVFVNNGSRSGVITSLVLELRLADFFSKYP